MLDAHPDQPVMPVAWIVDYADPAELRRLAAQHAMPILDAPSEGPGSPRYTLAGFGATFDRPWLPALIHRSVPRSHRPAALAAPHTRQPVGMSGLDVSGPVDEIADWCGGLPDGLRCTPGRHGIQAVTVAFADGRAHRFGPP